MIAILFAFALVTADDITGKVVSVTDGDTITVLVGQEPVKVRLNGIDAPERRQAFGTQAREKLAALVFGETVLVRAGSKDRYGRTLGTVIVAGQNANLEMLNAGLAWHYKAYSKDAELSRAEADARKAKLGLWADPAPVAPWDFRKKPVIKKAA
jgi:endonuclease YncB( thermonuclease family)